MANNDTICRTCLRLRHGLCDGEKELTACLWYETKENYRMDRENYCRDCDRSIWGKYRDCDVNIENNGKYVMANDKCYCKIVNGKRAEKYQWEDRDDK